MTTAKTGGQDPAVSTGRAAAMLALATLGFAVNFWAWALLSPLGPRFKDLLGLSAAQQALLVAVPVVVGSLGRIPVGALTDRFGGRVMFPLVSAATIVPVLFIGVAGQGSLPALLAGGFFLGIGGTVFAVGVPFVGAWFPPHRRGLALGVFGAGMGGTAISALTTVTLVKTGGSATPFLLTAAVLAVYAALAWMFLRDAPGAPCRPSRSPLGCRPPRACRSPGRRARCTRWRSAVTSPSPSTCRLTCRPPTAWSRPTPPTGWRGSCCWRS
ncbi:MFS transporter [Planomonospora algeriensis]